ncbi:hypothetical protein [Amycolatopsis sp. NPDC058986]|uniref:hypothetical protein n=1 Tax=unclassified Amycolatopsis TaxID=2618356 RepID=UPI00366B7303
MRNAIAELQDLALHHPADGSPLDVEATWYERKAATLRLLGGHDADADAAHAHAVQLLKKLADELAAVA